MPNDTSKVQGRRKVQYSSLRDVLADAERMSKGPVEALGNWSAGQIFLHLAKSLNTSIDGSDAKPSWFFRLMARMMKKRILRGPMPPGFKLPPAAAQVLVPGPTSTDEGLAALRAAIARQEREPKRAPSPFLGRLSHEEWTQLHLNHAALHMSFLVPRN
jgi:uncharacterized protein DUF1569